jgi:hypothetical protein
MSYIIGNKFRKLDWLKDGFRKPWVSRKYERDGQIVHDLRCDICGRWYNYSSRDIDKIKAEGRWNYSKNRPYHCGNSLCQDYHQRTLQHAVRIAKECNLYHDFTEKKRKL